MRSWIGTVAIKIFPAALASDQRRLQRFIRGAQAASALSHPHIVTVYEIVMNDTSPEIAALVRESLLARSGAERVLMGSRMFDTARAMVLASVPAGLSEIEIKGRLCEWLYSSEVDVEAFVEHLRSSQQGHQGKHDRSIPDEVMTQS
jgi:serine/threonine protein kinase